MPPQKMWRPVRCLLCFLAYKRDPLHAVLKIQSVGRGKISRMACNAERIWRIRLAFARAYAWAQARDHAHATILQHLLARRALRGLAQCTMILNEHHVPDAPSLPLRIHALTTEKERLERTLSCAVCWKRMRCVVALPCSHMATCEECGLRLTTCCICRATIETTVATYVA